MSDNTQQISDLPQAATIAADDHLVIRAAADDTDKRVPFEILTRDPLRAAVEAQSGGRMTVLYDDAGNPSHMHILPKFTYADLGFETELGSGTCSAFVVNGGEKGELFIGAYQASQVGSLACALPGAVPWVNIDWDGALAACANKGPGWHLMTMHEWAAVALWCQASGFQPRGNTAEGKAHDASWEHGLDADQSDETCTGTGPTSWRHNGDLSGIADLVGNVWEWQHGMKLVDGEIFAATDNHFSQPDAEWPSTGKFLSNDSGSPELAASAPSNGNEDATSVVWNNMQTAAGYESSELLRRLLIEPASIELQGRLYLRDFNERFPRRGGARRSGSDAGLAALLLHDARSHRHVHIGFRPAFVS